MKLVTYLQDKIEKWGFIIDRPEGEYVCCPQDVEDNISQIRKGGSCFNLEQTFFMPEGKWPEEIASFLALEESGMTVLRKMYDFMRHYAFEQDAYWCSRYIFPLNDVKLKAPIPRPRIYWGLVANCPSFCRLDANRRYYNLVPQGHNRPQSCSIGMGETLVIDESNLYADKKVISFDMGFNVELGIIIGKKGRNIKAKDAMKYVAGYTNIMDLAPLDYFNELDPEGTAPEEKRTEKDFFLAATASWGGKKMDCMAPMGPYLVTRDEIVNPYDLICYTKQNGQKRDRCWTGALMVGIERVIEYYSSFATLYPGDVLHMATMGIDGLCISNSVEARPEDTLEVEIEQLGNLKMHFCRPQKNDWREPEDPTRGKYRASSVRDVVQSGKSECSSFHPEETRNFIICFGNYKSCMEEEGMIPVKDIPRFMNNPVSALTVDNETKVAPRMTEADVSMELAVVIKKVASKVNEDEAEDYILGYSPMIAILDNSLYNELNKPATGQETGLTKCVYSRWGDGYNILLPEVVKASEDKILSSKMNLEIEGVGSIHANTGDYLSTAKHVIAVISKHITLMPNDVISLGRVGKLVHLSKEHVLNGIKGKISIENLGEFEFSYTKD